MSSFPNIGVAINSALNAPVEHPLLIRVIFALILANEMANDRKKWESQKQLTLSLSSKIRDIGQTQLDDLLNKDWHCAIGKGAAEMFGYRLSKAIGVNVPEIRLIEAGAARYPTGPRLAGYYVKSVLGGYVASKRVRRAIPLSFLSDKAVTLPPFIDRLEKAASRHNWVLKSYMGIGESRTETKIRLLMDKPSPLDRAYYYDFSSTDETRESVLRAAQWDSEQRRLFYAFRAFLYSTYPHNSNILADVDGRLWLIDFSHIVYADSTADIDALAELAIHSPYLLKACQQVAAITESDIRKALSDIPTRFWQGGVLTNEQTAAEYLIKRLKAWQQLLGV